MLKVYKTTIVDKDSDKYLSFPDIIKSPNAQNRLFLIYREGNGHHPVWSKLVLWISNNNGETWEKRAEFRSYLLLDGYVWNCPRLSYVGNNLHIICDCKNGTKENVAEFSTVYFISTDDGIKFDRKEVPHPGMVPDKIIPFKDKLLCANHKIKSSKNDLIQLVSWSRDNGRTWYDTNVVAHSLTQQYCEASIVNMGEYLIAYLRDNRGHQQNIYTTCSTDGIHWGPPQKEKIIGQRVTALKDQDYDKMIVGAYRDTRLNNVDQKLQVSAFEHNLSKWTFEVSKIDWEYAKNQYHFGYTGMARIAPGKYIIAYYIKQNENNPYIKLAHVSKIKQ